MNDICRFKDRIIRIHNKLYHSKDLRFGGHLLLIIAGGLLVATSPLLIYCLLYPGCDFYYRTCMFLIFYIGIISFYLILLYFYIYGKCDFSNIGKKLKIKFFGCITLITLVFMIPFIIVIIVIFNTPRLRKMVNDYIPITLPIVVLTYACSFIILMVFVSNINELVSNFEILRFLFTNMKPVPLLASIIVGGPTVLSFIIHRVVLRVSKENQNVIGELFVENSNEEQYDKIISVDKSKSVGNAIMAERLTWLVHLFYIICIFAYATFSADELVIMYSGDIVNVISLVSLVILLFDKCKEYFNMIDKNNCDD